MKMRGARRFFAIYSGRLLMLYFLRNGRIKKAEGVFSGTESAWNLQFLFPADVFSETFS